MSLVTTYVESQSGAWYENPVVRGSGWFICWDDDEPIELVVDEASGLKAEKILSDLRRQGWRLSIVSRSSVGAMRLFDGKTFKPAKAYFLRQDKFGPTDEMLKESKRCAAKPFGQGVYYTSTKNGNGGFK